MKYVRKHFVEYMYPGTFVHNTSIHEIKHISKLDVPNNAFGFQFFDVLSAEVEVEGKIVELKSERRDQSPMHYYGGQVYTLEELKREIPNERILIDNIEMNGHRAAIRCRPGNWQTFDDKDVFVAVGCTPRWVFKEEK